MTKGRCDTVKLRRTMKMSSSFIDWNMNTKRTIVIPFMQLPPHQQAQKRAACFSRITVFRSQESQDLLLHSVP